jgi:outer membrane protease
MSESSSASSRFAVCIRNPGYEAALERNKIYVVVFDIVAERKGDVRVIDKSGDDFLYPSEWFVPIDVPEEVESSLLKQRA